MRAIHQYLFDINDRLEIDMPAGARILSVQPRKGQPCLWAIVDPDQPVERRHFRLYGTTHVLGAEAAETYIGTFLLYGDAFAFHLFEVR